MKYKIGDRVIARDYPVDKIGTIVNINTSLSQPYAVKFEDFEDGHSCLNKGDVDCGSSGRWMADDEIQLYQNKTVDPKELIRELIEEILNTKKQ